MSFDNFRIHKRFDGLKDSVAKYKEEKQKKKIYKAGMSLFLYQLHHLQIKCHIITTE